MNELIQKEDLIIKTGKLRMCFERENLSNHTASEIVIFGNRHGFLNLSHILIYHLNMLDSEIIVNDFPFIESDLKFEIKIDDLNLFVEGEITLMQERFIWRIGANNLTIIATLIQSLAYINDELHIDHEMDEKAISLYLVIDDTYPGI